MSKPYKQVETPKPETPKRVVKSMQTTVPVPDPAGGAYRSTFLASRYELNECPAGIAIGYQDADVTVVPHGNVASYVLGVA